METREKIKGERRKSESLVVENLYDRQKQKKLLKKMMIAHAHNTHMYIRDNIAYTVYTPQENAVCADLRPFYCPRENTNFTLFHSGTLINMYSRT